MPDRAGLQEQIVELRLRLDQAAEGQAALIEHVARREVRHAMAAVETFSDDDIRSLREMVKARARWRSLMHDVGVHLAKWGAGGALGFVAYAVWERIKGIKS